MIYESSEKAVILHTNFGDIFKIFNASEGDEQEIKLAGNQIGFNLDPGEPGAPGMGPPPGGGSAGGSY